MHMILRLKPKNNNLKGKFLEMSTFGSVILPELTIGWFILWKNEDICSTILLVKLINNSNFGKIICFKQLIVQYEWHLDYT